MEIKKVVNIVLTFILVFSLITVGYFLRYLQKPNDAKPTSTLIIPSIIPTSTFIQEDVKTFKVNGINFTFDSLPTWQILVNETIKQENGFSQKSVAINLDKPQIIGNFGFSTDIMIVDYLLLPEKETLTNIKDIISSIGRGEGKNLSTFNNKYGLEITKSEEENDLYATSITTYYIQYKDKEGKKHYIVINSLINDNGEIIKAIKTIVNSLQVLT